MIDERGRALRDTPGRFNLTLKQQNIWIKSRFDSWLFYFDLFDVCGLAKSLNPPTRFQI